MKKILFCLLIACVPSLSFARYEGVCREAEADGFEVQHSRALEVFRSLGVPEKVDDLEDTVVYVEAYPKIVDPKSRKTISESGFYYHSNFVTPGFGGHSTKVAHPTNDIRKALENIFFPKPSEGIQRTLFLSALENDVVFVFHVEVLSSPTPLNLGPIREFDVVDSKGNRVKVKREKEDEQYRCSFDNPCWDKEKNQLAEICDSETTHPTVSLLNALVQGAISGFQCSIEGIAKQ